MTTFCIVTTSGKIFFVRSHEAQTASNFITEVGHQAVVCCTEQRGEVPNGASVFEV